VLGRNDEGSLEGRGEDELLPRKGDPFTSRAAQPNSSQTDPQSDIYPVGEERSEDYKLMKEENNSAPSIRPREDGGMRAVGQPLPEDLEAVEVPPPTAEPELPPSSNNEAGTRFSTLDESEPGPVDESLPPFLRSKDADPGTGSESLLVSDIRVNWLRERADQLEVRIEREIENPPLSKLLLGQLSLARDQKIKNREQFDQAERVLNEVENRINLAQSVRAWSASVRMRLLLLEIALALVIILGLIFLPDAIRSTSFGDYPVQFSGILSSLDILVNSMLWGGLGGVFSALIGLQTHRVLEEDVDRNWAIWYFATPFMGVVLGSFLFLILRAILLLVFPSTAGIPQVVWILYVICWVLGFQQNLAYDLVERLMGLFKRS
jgi:hypothetical protein